MAQDGVGGITGGPYQRWLRYAASGLLIIATVVIAAILWRQTGEIGEYGLILLLNVAASAYLAGGMAGMLSAAIVLFGSLVLFSHPLQVFRYSELDWRQMMVIIVACPVIALMVGSLQEQVERLKAATSEVQALQEELRGLKAAKEAQFQSEQRFQLMAECMGKYAICMLDAGGSVWNWNVGAERVLGYTDLEIAGQSYSRFFTKEDLLARLPERLLDQARFSGRAMEEGWRLRKGGGRFAARTTLLAAKTSQGAPAGCLLVIEDLTTSPAADSVSKA